MMDRRGRWILNAGTLLLVGLTLAACGAPHAVGSGAAPSGTARSPFSRQGTETLPTKPPVPTPPVTPPAEPTGTRAASPPPPASMLIITPAAGPAGTVFEITGTGLSPNATLYALGRAPDLEPVALLGPGLWVPVTVGADGTLTLRVDSRFRPTGPYIVEIGADQGVMMRPLLARGTFMITEGGPAPTVALEPDQGPCTGPDPHVLVRGRNFPPGPSILLALYHVGGMRYVSGVVDADGAFAWPVRLTGCGSTTPEGTRLRVNVIRREHNVHPEKALASATFTVSASAPPLPVLPTEPPERRFSPPPVLPTPPGECQ